MTPVTRPRGAPVAVLNAANLITSWRIFSAPLLVLLSWRGYEHIFVACLLLSLISDVADGQVARRLKLTSEFGARLDSWADFMTCAAVLVATSLLRPDLFRTEQTALALVACSFGVPIGFGMLKFGRLTSYHTTLARLAAFLLGAAAIVVYLHGPTQLLRIAVYVLVVAELEEIGITFVLSEPRSDVRSLRKALIICSTRGPATEFPTRYTPRP
jgi:cardiolipin synthase